MIRSVALFIAICILGTLSGRVAASGVAGVIPTPTRTDLHRQTDPAMTSALGKRCQEHESCPDITAGPEVPIAVTTTMMSTVLVPCTTTTTVIDSQTSTLTIWSTAVQTQTVSVKGAQTVTVWLITPAPSIVMETYATNEVLTFTKERTATSFWTSTAPVQTMISTIDGPESTWTDQGVPASSNVPEPAPAVSTSSVGPAWTQTTALVASSSQIWVPPPPPASATSAVPTGVAPGAFGTVSNTIPFGETASGASSAVYPPPSGPVSITGTTYMNQGSPFVTGSSEEMQPRLTFVAVATTFTWWLLR